MEQKLEAFLNQRMRGDEAELEEVIAVGMALGEEIPYTHAVAILTHDKGETLIFSDSAAEQERYWPTKPAGLRDKSLFKLGDMADQYLIITLFKLKKEIVDENRRDKLMLELEFIMTGIELVEVIKKKEIQGAAKSHEKRKSTA
jgi:hypothetical protein